MRLVCLCMYMYVYQDAACIGTSNVRLLGRFLKVDCQDIVFISVLWSELNFVFSLKIYCLSLLSCVFFWGGVSAEKAMC